jgi:hypothetical protein
MHGTLAASLQAATVLVPHVSPKMCNTVFAGVAGSTAPIIRPSCAPSTAALYAMSTLQQEPVARAPVLSPLRVPWLGVPVRQKQQPRP